MLSNPLNRDIVERGHEALSHPEGLVFVAEIEGFFGVPGCDNVGEIFGCGGLGKVRFLGLFHGIFKGLEVKQLKVV